MIKIDQFCSLATSPAWQAWLFHYSRPLYDELIDKLRSSHGCGHNREIMEGILQKITIADGTKQLSLFLKQHFPHALEESSQQPIKTVTKEVEPNKHKVFPHYDPQLLTFPRRLILTGERQYLIKHIKSFMVGKLKVEYIIIDDCLYIEYLTKDMDKIADKIPTKNWYIPIYRKNNNI